MSPLLGNIYLHNALDTWFEDQIRPRLQGHGYLIRYADDFVLGFERREDAQRVMAVLGRRLQRFGLSLQAAKTRLIPYQRPPRSRQQGKGPGTFDFLGFTWYWRRSRKGVWVPTCKTRPARRQARADEARRFVNLVDALYENKVKLVMSGEAPPDGLYPAGDAAFAFKRAVSRLHEMQSSAYLAAEHLG